MSEALKPLVLLDIDGVLNSYPDDGTEEHVETWRGRMILIGADTVSALQNVFHAASEVLWLTAWREQANVEPLMFLQRHAITSKAELDVISDGGRFGQWNTGWKLNAAKQNWKVRTAIQQGREVIWIEDFGWGIPRHHSAVQYTDITAAGITPIDTAKVGRLTPAHIEDTALAYQHEWCANE